MPSLRLNLMALLFAGLALLGLPRLLRGWRTLVAPERSAEGEALAVYLAALVAVPLATLAHECGHLVVARALGAGDATLHYRVFWGYVEYGGELPGLGGWWVALAGNVVSWALAAASLLAARRSLPPGLRSAARLFGRLEMLHTLLVYPLLSLANLVGACWAVLYSRPFWMGTGVVAAAHAASLVWLRRELRASPPETPPASPAEPGQSEEVMPPGEAQGEGKAQGAPSGEEPGSMP